MEDGSGVSREHTNVAAAALASLDFPKTAILFPPCVYLR